MSHEPRLHPREHGAYAMLAFPLVSGLVMGGPSWAGVAFGLLAVAGFLAHESVLVVLGRRGERIRSAQALHARARLLRLGAAVLMGGTVFGLTAPSVAWPPTLVTGVLATSVGALLLAGKTKTLPGELLVGATFASVHGVVAAAGGASPRAVWLPMVAWALSFAVATLAVHALKFRFKGRGPGRWTVPVVPVLAGALVALAAVALVAGHPMGGVAAALVPKGVVVLSVAVLSVHPRHMKRVGWSFVAADGLTLVILAAALGAQA